MWGREAGWFLGSWHGYLRKGRTGSPAYDSGTQESLRIISLTSPSSPTYHQKIWNSELERMETSHVAGGKAHTQPLWKTAGWFPRSLHIQSYHTAQQIHFYVNVCSDKNLYMNACSSIIHNSQTSINWQQNVIYSYNVTLLGNKKKWSTYSCYNMDKAWKYFDK